MRIFFQAIKLQQKSLNGDMKKSLQKELKTTPSDLTMANGGDYGTYSLATNDNKASQAPAFGSAFTAGDVLSPNMPYSMESLDVNLTNTLKHVIFKFVSLQEYEVNFLLQVI
mgnify:CR=1 FL=1